MSDLPIGKDYPPKVILDFCWNHGGSLETVHLMIQSLRSIAADAGRSILGLIIKFQMGRHLPWKYDEHKQAKELVENYGHIYLCTAFNKWCVEILEKLNVQAIKIGSAEATPEFVEYCLQTKKQLIVSTGGMDQGQVAEIMGLILSHVPQVAETRHVIMQCTSMYPPAPQYLHLGVVREWSDQYDGPVGYSSHYPGIEDALFAIAMGANVVEKHFSLWPGGTKDHAVSIGPSQAVQLAKAAANFQLMKAPGKIAYPAEVDLLSKYR